MVGIPQPDQRARQYPHEFSGGMRQRVMIAMAIANDPDVLIADEPTTALDVTVQAQILDVIDRIRRDFNTAVVMITHDLGVIARIADRVQVMYAGRVVERTTVHELFDHPTHPYTQGLLLSIPRHGSDAAGADRRLTAQHAASTVGLRVPHALPVRDRRLRRRPARAAADRQRPSRHASVPMSSCSRRRHERQRPTRRRPWSR